MLSSALEMNVRADQKLELHLGQGHTPTNVLSGTFVWMFVLMFSLYVGQSLISWKTDHFVTLRSFWQIFHLSSIFLVAKVTLEMADHGNRESDLTPWQFEHIGPYKPFSP